jgi:hypothetical protein
MMFSISKPRPRNLETRSMLCAKLALKLWQRNPSGPGRPKLFRYRLATVAGSFQQGQTAVSTAYFFGGHFIFGPAKQL